MSLSQETSRELLYAIGASQMGRRPDCMTAGCRGGCEGCTLSREIDEMNRLASFGTGDSRYDTRTTTAPVYGYTSDGYPVTASFGRDGTSREGHTFLADGHVSSPQDFWGNKKDKGHDHFDGQGNAKQRGKYTGSGS